MKPKSVWVFMQGERRFGGSILGIYSTKRKAYNAIRKEADNPNRPFYPECNWNVIGNEFTAGCDWYRVVKVTVK